MVTLNAIASQDSSLIIDDENQDSFSIQQAPDITGSDNPEIIFGTDGDDIISALGGDDTIIGTTGSDLIDGGDGTDTVDYSNLGEAVTILPAGEFDNGAQTQLVSIENIIGATGQQNTIDGSSASDSASLNVDLDQGSLIVRDIPVVGSLSLGVDNFVDVTGTNNADLIRGNDLNNSLTGRNGDDELTGQGGNDVLLGGPGNDLINGADSILRGANEQDRIFGGSGGDRFLLGDENGSFYVAAGEADFVEILDFSAGDIIQLGADETYSVQRTDSGFNLFAEQESGEELVAKVQFSVSDISSISSRSTAAIISDGSNNFDSQIELPTDSFQLGSGETLDIFTVA